MNVNIKLLDDAAFRLTVPCTVNSTMLTNHLSFVDDSDPITMDLQLTSAEWQLYEQFVTAVAALEKDSGKKFKPNPEFSKDFFTNFDQSQLDSFAKVERYLISDSLRYSLDYFIGSLFDMNRDDILKAYGINESETERQRSIKQARGLINEKLVEKIKEIVPELSIFNVNFLE